MTVKTPSTPFYDRFIKELDKLNSAKEIKRCRLSLCEVHMIWVACREMFTGHQTETISQSVARWFKKNGFVVSQHGTGWEITLPENERKGIAIEK